MLIFSCNSLVGTKGEFGRYYDACRERGMRHNKALEAVARKRLKVIYAAMRGRPPLCSSLNAGNAFSEKLRRRSLDAHAQKPLTGFEKPVDKTIETPPPPCANGFIKFKVISIIDTDRSEFSWSEFLS